jgi:putative DNA primase/helicase
MSLASSPTEQAGTTQKFKLYSVADVIALKQPPWLIEGVLEEGAFAVLYGASKSGKSFTALAWALSIATGGAWHGRATKKGRVVYVVGEGTIGAGKRVRAWMKHNAVETVAEAFFLLKAPRLGIEKDSDLDELITVLKADDVKPTLIVLDTFARCFVGGDENSAKEVGQFVEACRRIQTETGATVLVVHHTGKAKTSKGERGSSALRAAADVMIAQAKDQERIRITNEKQKDEEEFEPVTLKLKVIDLGNDSAADRKITSCVLVDSDGEPESPSLHQSQQKALVTLKQLSSATSSQWRAALETELGGVVSPKSFDNWRKALLAKNLIEKEGIEYAVSHAGHALLKVA